MGSDVGLHVGKNFIESFPDRVVVSQLIPELNRLKRLGEKTGKGFYKVSGCVSMCVCARLHVRMCVGGACGVCVVWCVCGGGGGPWTLDPEHRPLS